MLARILIFYILTLILISFNIPYTYPNLATASTATSPFTIIFDMVGSKVGGSFMNTGSSFSCIFLAGKPSLTVISHCSHPHLGPLRR